MNKNKNKNMSEAELLALQEKAFAQARLVMEAEDMIEYEELRREVAEKDAAAADKLADSILFGEGDNLKPKN